MGAKITSPSAPPAGLMRAAAGNSAAAEHAARELLKAVGGDLPTAAATLCSVHRPDFLQADTLLP